MKYIEQIGQQWPMLCGQIHTTMITFSDLYSTCFRCVSLSQQYWFYTTSIVMISFTYMYHVLLLLVIVYLNVSLKLFFDHSQYTGFYNTCIIYRYYQLRIVLRCFFFTDLSAIFITGPPINRHLAYGSSLHIELFRQLLSKPNFALSFGVHNGF